LHVRARDNEPRAEVYKLTYVVDIAANSADAENLAVRLACFRRGLISGPQFRIFQLAGNAHGGAQIV